MTDEDAVKPKHSHWIANGFPSNWQSEEILQFLAEQQWQDVSVINRGAKRKDTPTWWLRARPPGEGESAQDSYVYEVDGHGWGCNRIYLNKAPPKAVAITCSIYRVQRNNGRNRPPRKARASMATKFLLRQPPL